MVCEAGQRALVGKVCMDREAPPTYVERCQDSIDDTRRCVGVCMCVCVWVWVGGWVWVCGCGCGWVGVAVRCSGALRAGITIIHDRISCAG